MQENAVFPQADLTLDMKGKDCPLPVLRAKLALMRLESGKVLHVIATDPHASVDFRAFCARTGHELAHEALEGGVLHFYIRRVTGARV